MVISVWQGTAARSHPGHIVEPLVSEALSGSTPQWLSLTRGDRERAVSPGARAPVVHDPYRSTCYLPPEARTILAGLRGKAEPDSVYARALTGLLSGLPPAPGSSPCA